MTKLFADYRPERHYMRGPGPKWLEKHGLGRAGEIAHDRASDASLVKALARTLVSCRPRRWKLRSRLDE